MVKQNMSRKWFLVLLIFSIATLGTFLPPLISAWVFGASVPLVILSGTEWVSVISMVTAAYIGGNVWQKREEMRSGQVNVASGASYAPADAGYMQSSPFAPTDPNAPGSQKEVNVYIDTENQINQNGEDGEA